MAELECCCACVCQPTFPNNALLWLFGPCVACYWTVRTDLGRRCHFVALWTLPMHVLADDQKSSKRDNAFFAMNVLAVPCCSTLCLRLTPASPFVGAVPCVVLYA
jgi:hypothetical protein